MSTLIILLEVVTHTFKYKPHEKMAANSTVRPCNWALIGDNIRKVDEQFKSESQMSWIVPLKTDVIKISEEVLKQVVIRGNSAVSVLKLLI